LMKVCSLFLRIFLKARSR